MAIRACRLTHLKQAVIGILVEQIGNLGASSDRRFLRTKHNNSTVPAIIKPAQDRKARKPVDLLVVGRNGVEQLKRRLSEPPGAKTLLPLR